MSALTESPEVLRAAANELVARVQFARAMGLTYEGKRDLATTFGYVDRLTLADYRLRYERGGIAGRIVDAIAKATWRGGVELIEDEDPETLTDFEQAWISLEDRLHVTAKLQSTDILSRLGSYAVLLIGNGSGAIESELEKGNGSPDSVLFLTPFCGNDEAHGARRAFTAALEGIAQADAVIDSLEMDPKSPRFGLPKGYRLRRLGFGAEDFSARVVHWSRVVHIAEDCLDDQVYGKPALRLVWNYLDDLEKVVGGGSEAFFQRANQGRLWNIDKDVKDLSDDDRKDFRDQIEKWEHGISRNVRARGLTVQDLGSDVANFSNQMDGILTLIAGACGIPKRILTGSEMGELASGQDRDNWRDQVNGRREQHAGPYVLRLLTDRLITYNYLPEPDGYEPRWGTVMNLTEDERRTKAQAWAATNSTLVAAGLPPAFLTSEIREQCYEMAPLTAEQIAAEAPEPEVAAPPESEDGEALFPRAASAADDALVERLAIAIEANDTTAIDAIMTERIAAFNPDQPRDEQGRWTESHAIIEAYKASGKEALTAKGGFHIRGVGFVSLKKARKDTGIDMSRKRRPGQVMSSWGDYATVEMFAKPRKDTK